MRTAGAAGTRDEIESDVISVNCRLLGLPASAIIAADKGAIHPVSLPLASLGGTFLDSFPAVPRPQTPPKSGGSHPS